jgi:hypothetical protein
MATNTMVTLKYRYHEQLVDDDDDQIFEEDEDDQDFEEDDDNSETDEQQDFRKKKNVKKIGIGKKI